MLKSLSQLLAIVGASSCPILYYGSKSLISEEERKVDWTIELTNSEGSKELSGRKWKYQDAEIKKWCWPDNFGDDESNDIYKLQLKKGFTEKHKRLPKGLSFRNPFELIKVGFSKKNSTGGSGNALQFGRKDEKLDFLKDKLHLLVLKTANSINFVSALKSSDDNDYAIDDNRWKQITQVNHNKWKKAKNKKLTTPEGEEELTLERKKSVILKDQVQSGTSCSTATNYPKIVWKPWALMKLGDEKWVVLDWIGLGAGFNDYGNVQATGQFSQGTNQLKDWDFFQSKLKEKVTEAISIKFEEVVISDEGIGDGKDIQIKWSGDNRPKFISQLNR